MIAGFGSGLCGRPVVREQFSESGDGVRGDAGKDILEPDEGIDSSPLASSYETPQHRGRLAALALTVAGQPFPVIQCVARCPPLRTLRQDFRLDLRYSAPDPMNCILAHLQLPSEFSDRPMRRSVF